MKQISFSILLVFLLLCNSSVYGQKTIEKNSDSIATKKANSKSNFTSRQSSLLKSKKSLHQKTNNNASQTRKDYLKPKDSLYTKRKISSNSLYLQKRMSTKDSIRRVYIMSKHDIRSKEAIQKADTLTQKKVKKNKNIISRHN